MEHDAEYAWYQEALRVEAEREARYQAELDELNEEDDLDDHEIGNWQHVHYRRRIYIPDPPPDHARYRRRGPRGTLPRRETDTTRRVALGQKWRPRLLWQYQKNGSWKSHHRYVQRTTIQSVRKDHRPRRRRFFPYG